MNTILKDRITLCVCIIICELAGIIGSAFSFSAIPTWYAALQKPRLNPPAWVFGPVWTTLFALMGIAVFLVLKRGWSQRKVKTALVVFGAQLIANTLWSIIFFGFHAPFAALIDILFLWILIAITIVLFYHQSKLAAVLLVPYLCWVSFATYLNYMIYQLN